MKWKIENLNFITNIKNINNFLIDNIFSYLLPNINKEIISIIKKYLISKIKCQFQNHARQFLCLCSRGT